MNSDFNGIWVYLSASPLVGLTLTLIAYILAHRIYSKTKQHPLLNPVAVAIVIIILVLLVTNTSYETYFEGAQFVHFLLGPATVALAIPLYQQCQKLRQIWLPLSLSLFVGVSVASLSAIGIAHLLGASTSTILSLAPKSVTAPVAMGIAENIGGLPALTAVLVVITGILGAIIGTRLFSLLRIQDDSVKGVAMGVTSHGIGTARAFQVSQEMGAFSGLAMALAAFLTSVTLPWFISLLNLGNF